MDDFPLLLLAVAVTAGAFIGFRVTRRGAARRYAHQAQAPVRNAFLLGLYAFVGVAIGQDLVAFSHPVSADQRFSKYVYALVLGLVYYMLLRRVAAKRA